MGVAALILGIFALIMSFLTWVPYCAWFCFGLGAAAIVLAAVGMGKAKKAGKSAGTAVAGLVLGIVGVAIGSIIYAACYEVTSAAEDLIEYSNSLY